ncbi:MAG TPA: hypothetical protein DHV69_01050, partial [Sphaerochaeta sp.]|nr:hypothetical protein [Sphaerochaeta sp.]
MRPFQLLLPGCRTWFGDPVGEARLPIDPHRFQGGEVDRDGERAQPPGQFCRWSGHCPHNRGLLVLEVH